MEKEPIIINEEIWKQKLEQMEALCVQAWNEVKKLEEKGIIKDELGCLGYWLKVVIPALKKYTGVDELNYYAAYHALIWSSTSFKSEPNFDLYGDRIVNFTKELFEKLQLASQSGKLEL